MTRKGEDSYIHSEICELGFDGCSVDGNLDDDGRLRRTGTVWTASAHIITGVIGSGILSLAWAVAQLGWIAGPVTLLIFALITFYTSRLLADCYRSPVTGKRNYTYLEAVQANLGRRMSLACGFIQYIYLFGTAIGYTITASTSMAAAHKSNCFHKRGHEASCKISTNLFMISFGILQIILSQIPNFAKLTWLSIVAAVMSFAYASIVVGLSLAKVISGHTGKTSLEGATFAMELSDAEKVWNMFSALGDIAFAYTFSQVLIEIQDTVRSPGETKVMKTATLMGVSTTSVFYLLCGCIGYAAFGNHVPGNMLTGFGFYEPFWLVDFGNACIVVHLVGAYQVFSQPLFAAIELWTVRRWPMSKFITKEYPISICGKSFQYGFNIFRLTWRTVFVVLVTVLAMAIPFFNDILAFLGAIGYWPLTVFFPVQMYISQQRIKKFTSRWVGIQLMNLGCLLVAVAAACGSIEGVIKELGVNKPFKSKQ